MIKIESNHYSFNVVENSIPHTEIAYIIETQEDAYDKILRYLDYTSDLHINYFLLDSPTLCGNQFNLLRREADCEQIDALELNAFAWYPDMIYATYNNNVHAIGCHEDTHLLSYDYFKQLSSRFVTEGFAVAMDEYWLGKHVHVHSKEILEKNIISLREMFLDTVFDETKCLLSYPVAGSVCFWIIQEYGMETMKEVYRKSLKNPLFIIEEMSFGKYYSFLQENIY